MRCRLRTILMVTLGVLLAGALCLLAGVLLQYRQGEQAYEAAEALIDLPDWSLLLPPHTAESHSPPPSAEPAAQPSPQADPYEEALGQMDFSKLQAVNSEVVGWIVIPGTALSYPLLHTDSNSYYLRHTWNKADSIVGAIFLEQTSSPELSDFHTIIYGHNTSDGSMFGSLKRYREEGWLEAHPAVYLSTADGSFCYEIFAVYEVSHTGLTYQIGFADEADRERYLAFCLSQSLIDTGIEPTAEDRILTLSTCTDFGRTSRWVVQGVLRAEEQE